MSPVTLSKSRDPPKSAKLLLPLAPPLPPTAESTLEERSDALEPGSAQLFLFPGYAIFVATYAEY